MTLLARTVPKLRFYATSFLITGTIYGATMALLQPVGVVKGAMRGVIFGVFMTSFFAVMQPRATKRPSGAGYFAARQEVSLVRRGRLDLMQQRAVEALRRLGGKVVHSKTDSGALLRTRTRISWRSWGEVVVVSLSSTGSGQVRITVASRPAIPITLTDYGKSFENVASVVAALESASEASA